MRSIVPTFYYSCVRQPFRILAIAILAALFATNIYRAATQSIAHDEAITYHMFAAAPWSYVFNTYNANHHVLHTILCKISIGILGLSPFAMRVPSLLGGLLYLWLIFRICERLFGGGWYLPLSVSVLALNPYVLDFLSAARGYGMALAFFFLAFWEILEWLSEPKPQRLIRVGTALALSVASNLVLLPPALGLALMFLIAVREQRRSFQPAVTVSKKGTKKEEPNPYPTPGQAMLRLLVPFFGVAWLILMYPLSNASTGLFYAGAMTLRQFPESLVRYSLPLAPEWLVSVLALAVLPAVLVASAALACRALSRWAKAGLPERSLVLLAGIMTCAFLAVVLARLALDIPYPEGRTGIYWIPVLTLAGLLIAPHWPRATPILAIPFLACLATYAAEFRTSYYADWPYDADMKTIVRLIGDRKPNNLGRQIRVEGSWQFEPSVNFYRYSDHLDWLAEFERAPPKPGADYYLLLSQDSHFLNDLHLKPIFTGPQSGTILAQP
jgi:hypothetical protein